MNCTLSLILIEIQAARGLHSRKHEKAIPNVLSVLKPNLFVHDTSVIIQIGKHRQVEKGGARGPDLKKQKHEEGGLVKEMKGEDQ